jgi:putative SOS response-associated peptidase YedK
MCNEFAQERAWRLYCEVMAAEALEITHAAPDSLPNGSVHPSEQAAIIRAAPGGSRLDLTPWGWPPAGGKGLVINVRSENRRDPPGARGIALMDRFFEFRGEKAPKSKFQFSPAVNEPLAFAVVIRDGRFALVTTEPGPDVAEIHGRQPVILRPAQWREYLTGSAWPSELMAPSPAGTLNSLQVR